MPTETNTSSATLRVMVVDDSSLYRKVVSEALSTLPNVEVVGVAANGRIALDKIDQLKPHLLTLDLEMPELNGLGVLRELKDRQANIGAIVLSAFSTSGARSTTAALEGGAFDFALKPNTSSLEKSQTQLIEQLGPKIKAYQQSRTMRAAPKADSCIADAAPAQTRQRPQAQMPPSILGIGVSTGGPATLSQLIPKLPADFPVPVVIVQHMPPIFTKSLAEELDKASQVTVVEGADGMALEPAKVIIAPGGKQMKVQRVDRQAIVQVTDDPPEKSCRPAVDYLFRSLAENYGPACVGLVLTGMGDDGLLGCKLLKRRGATIIAQDEQSSVVYGMPRQIAEHGLADAVTSLDRLPQQIVDTMRSGVLSCS